MSNYVDLSGNRISLEREIGRGGEGIVYTVAGNPAVVAKVYFNPPAGHLEKLTAMTARANPRLNDVTAWPTRVFLDAASRRFAGFVMPRIDGCQPIQRLYNPHQRLQHFPQAGWNFQVRTAGNLAAAFEEVHRAGCLVGDVNERNIQISPQALVRLVDCDSFQVTVDKKAFLCEVGVAHYIPPELQGRSLSGLTRTENHDRFGLAVLIYQLLFVGRHPYQGRYQGRDDPSFEQLIKEYRFAQGPAASSWFMSPPPHVPTFSDIPPNLGTLFRRAFERGSEQNKRPTPKEWHDALGELESSLTKCTSDSGHSYWRGAAGDCPWCRLARNGGPEYYFGIGDAGRGFAPDERKLQEVLKRLEQLERIDVPYNRSDYQSPVSPPGNPVPERIAQLGQDVVRRTAEVRRLEADCAAQDRVDQDRANAKLKQFEASLAKQLGPKVQAADREAQAALLAVAAERRRRETVEPLLLGPALLGVVLMLFAVYHWAFAAIGATVAVVFGTSYVLYFRRARQTPGELRAAAAERMKKQVQAHYASQCQAAVQQLNAQLAQRKQLREQSLTSHQNVLQAATVRLQQEFNVELERLRRTLMTADQRVQGLEARRRTLVDSHVREQQASSEQARELVAACKRLADQFQLESKRVAANAEAAARIRHLRLCAINGADIPGIGFGRMQILAAHGINTAEDVDEQRIRQISGFGEVLTGRLLYWKSEMLREFRFSPATAAASGEVRSVAAHFKSQERQLHSELDRHMSLLASVASRCRATTAALAPELREALGQFERARIAEMSFLAAFQNRQAG